MVLGLVSERLTNGAFQLGRVVGNEVCQVGVLRVAPARLHGIEFRGIGRQEFELDVPQTRRRNLLRCRAMHAPAVPADDERTPKPLSQLSDKGDHLGSANVLFLNQEGRINSRS